MIRKIVYRITIFLTIILFSTGVLFIFYNKGGPEFPHYKQAILNLKGSVYAIEDKPINIPLVIIDEKQLSEMASPDNIESIIIFDNKGNSLDIDNWDIVNGIVEDEYMTRLINLKITYGQTGTYQVESVVFKFIDGYIKKYKFSELNIFVKSEKERDIDYTNAPYWFDVERIPAVDKGDLSFSGIVVVINHNKDINITDINLGNEFFGIDSKGILIKEGFRDLNTISKGRRDSQEWVDPFYSIKNVEESSQIIDPIILKSNEYQATTLFIPLTGIKSADKRDVFIFNLTFTLQQEGNEHRLYKLEPLVITPSVQIEINPVKILEERGK
jgi:hypothetical protein